MHEVSVCFFALSKNGLYFFYVLGNNNVIHPTPLNARFPGLNYQLRFINFLLLLLLLFCLTPVTWTK